MRFLQVSLLRHRNGDLRGPTLTHRWQTTMIKDFCGGP